MFDNLPLWLNSVMCFVCINTCSYKPNRKNITQEQLSAKLRNVLLTPARFGNRRNNDITPNCTTKNKTNMADIYTGAHAHSPSQWKLHSGTGYC